MPAEPRRKHDYAHYEHLKEQRKLKKFHGTIDLDSSEWPDHVWDMWYDDKPEDEIRRAIEDHIESERRAKEKAEQARRHREYVSSPKYERQLIELERRNEQGKRNLYKLEKELKLMFNKDIDDVFTDEIAPVKAAAHDAANALREYRQHVADANADDSLSEVGKAEKIQMFGQVAALKLDTTFEAAREGIEKINGAVSDILKPEENDYVAELKEQRAWARYERMLDNGHDPASVIRGASDDPVGIRALRADLPAYMSAHGKPSEGFLKELDRLERPHLSETKKRALDIKDEVAKGEYRLNVAEQAARGEIEDGATAYALATWPGDESGDVIHLDK